MKPEYYYVYCNGILGVKTNIQNFKWVYGSVAPAASAETYEKCAVKFHVCIKAEKDLDEIDSCSKKFQAFCWSQEHRTIYYRRAFLSKLKIGYNIRFKENVVEAQIGERYFKLVQNRTMNLHGIYYLLSDLANVLLLSRGYLTLYASAVCYEPDKRGVVCFAPPNTGKTVTATQLCEQFEYRLLGEDVVITDGKQLFSCPWTNSYRKKGSSLDSAGSFARENKSTTIKTCEHCDVTDLFVLSFGKENVSGDKDELLRQINILNGYLFQHFSSPIVKVLGYFDKRYSTSWNVCAEDLLRNMINHCNSHELQSEKAMDFYQSVHRAVSSERL